MDAVFDQRSGRGLFFEPAFLLDALCSYMRLSASSRRSAKLACWASSYSVAEASDDIRITKSGAQPAGHIS